jgi:copper resistance protein C
MQLPAGDGRHAIRVTGVAPAVAARRVVAVLVATVALAVVAVFLLGREPAVRLTGAWPDAGAVLAAPPTELVLTFTAAPRLVQAHAGVTGPGGTVLAEPVPRGTGVVVPVRPSGPGSYAVTYHLQLADGTSISGVRRWTVSGATPTAPGPDVAGPDVAGPDVAGPDAGDSGGHDHLSTDRTTPILLALDLVLIAVIVPVLLPRRRRR